MGAFRVHGFSDEETVAWCEMGMPFASAASPWKIAGYSPDQVEALLPWFQQHDSYSLGIEGRLAASGADPDFVVLCAKAGATSEAEIVEWAAKDNSDPKFRQTLTMMAALLLEP